MGIFNRNKDGPQKRSEPSRQMQEFIRGVDVDFTSSNCASGVSVDEMRSMQTSAVYACVKILSESVASLPLQLYKREKNGQKEIAKEHPLFSCLYDSPNEEMTSFEFRETMMTSLLLYGNAYARIIRKQGHVCELWYLKPQFMTVERDVQSGKIKYTYSDDITNKTYVFKPSQVLHLKGLSVDGVKGLSPIAQAREAVGLSLATEEYGARFFGNGARPGGVLEHPGVLKDPERLRESWNQVYQGARNSSKIGCFGYGEGLSAGYGFNHCEGVIFCRGYGINHHATPRGWGFASCYGIWFCRKWLTSTKSTFLTDANTTGCYATLGATSTPDTTYLVANTSNGGFNNLT